jgi:hypothetical protein
MYIYTYVVHRLMLIYVTAYFTAALLVQYISVNMPLMHGYGTYQVHFLVFWLKKVRP